jgi:Exocyst complex component Sec6
MSISEELRVAIGSEYFDSAGDEDDDYCRCFFDFVMSILDPAHDNSPVVPSWQKTSRLLASKAQLASAMNEDYTEVLLDQAQFLQHQEQGSPSMLGDSSSSSSTNLRMHLAAASHLLQEFAKLQRRVRREASELGTSTSSNTYFLPESLLETVFGEVVAFLRPRISDLYRPVLPELTPRDAAAIVAWIQHWDETLFRSYHHDGGDELSPDLDGFATDREMLLDLYVERAVVRELQVLREQLQLGNLLAAEDDVLRKSPDDGSMVSTVPEQITFMVDSQIRVARECLPEICVGTVLAACNRQLSLLVGDWMLAVGSDWKNIPTHWFCTIVNDSTRLAELCEERNQSVLAGVDDDEDASRVAADAIVREFQELASHAILFLCENIVSQLREPEPILSLVGARGWESDDTQSAIERTIATLKDYYADLEVWLAGSYWLPKVLKHCFDLTLQVYVESFFANTLAGGVQDPSRAAQELNDDYLRLVIFYNSDRFEPFHGTGGYYTQQAINSKLHIIRCLSKLVDPDVEPDDTSGEVLFLMRELIGDASAVLHLAGLRKRHKGRESVEWLRVVSKAKRALLLPKVSPRAGPGGASFSAAAQYKLPDLRNSKYLSNVRPNARDARRRLSVESLALAQSTGRLLKISLGGEKPKTTTS